MYFRNKLLSSATVLGLLILPTHLFAATNPFTYSFTPSSGLPTTTYVGGSYNVTYTLTNNLPFNDKMKQISLRSVTGSGFSIQNDACSGQVITKNGGTCTFTVNLQPSGTGSVSAQPVMAYDVNIVPMNTLTSSTQPALTQIVSGVVTTPLPSSTVVNTGYPVVFTFSNSGTGAATPSSIQFTGSTADLTNVINNCNSPIQPNGNCTISGTFTPTNQLTNAIGVTYTYNGTQTVPLTTSTTTIVPNAAITGTITKSIGSPTSTQAVYPFILTFSNTGNVPITETSVPLTGDDTAGVPLNSLVNGCVSTPTLQPSQSCTITGNYTPTSAGAHTLGATYNYTYNGSQSVPLTMNTTANTSTCTITSRTILALPTNTYEYADNVVAFEYTNTCPSTDATISASQPTITPSGVSGTIATVGQNTCTGTLAHGGGTCIAYASIIPGATGGSAAALNVTANLNYTMGGSGSTSSSTSTVVTPNNYGSSTSRMITVVNQCPFPVWMTFQAAAVPGSGGEASIPCTANPSVCPTGSSCNINAGASNGNGGNVGECFYNNPAIDQTNHPNGYLAQVGSDGVPATMDITVPQNNSGPTPNANIIYNAGIAARLNCSGSGSTLACTNNNCGGTVTSGGTGSDGMCLPGVDAESTPMTFNAAEFTFLLNYSATPTSAAQSSADGVYDEQTINGVNVPIEIKGRGPNTGGLGSAPYGNCQPGGAIIQQPTGSSATQLGNCTYDYSGSPTTSPNGTTVNASNYSFVIPNSSDIGACTASSQCTVSGDVCGLSYTANGNYISQQCGVLQGYTSVNTGICSQPASLFSANLPNIQTQYNCSNTYSSGSNTYTGANLFAAEGGLGSCYLHNASPNTYCAGCVDWWTVGGITVPTSTTSCTLGGTTYSNPNWTSASGIVQPQIQWVKKACPTAYSYQYDDPSSSFQCTVTNSGATQIVTNYQVTFCPGGATITNPVG